MQLNIKIFDLTYRDINLPVTELVASFCRVGFLSFEGSVMF